MNLKLVKDEIKKTLKSHYRYMLIPILISFGAFILTRLFDVPCSLKEMVSYETRVFCIVIDIILSITFVLTYIPFQVGKARQYMSLFRTGQYEKYSVAYDDVKKSYSILQETLSFFVALFLTIIGFIFFIVPGIMMLMQFSLLNYIFADEPEISFDKAIRKTFVILRGHYFEYFKIFMSFSGWFIVGILTCGIGFLYVIPYFEGVKTKFYMYCYEEKEAELNEINKIGVRNFYDEKYSENTNNN